MSEESDPDGGASASRGDSNDSDNRDSDGDDSGNDEADSRDSNETDSNGSEGNGSDGNGSDDSNTSAGTDDAWTVLESTTEYETGWYAGGYDLVEQPDGSTKRYYWAALEPAVVVVAIDGDEVVFVEQYRPTVRETQLELVAGIVDEHDGDATEPVEPEAYERAARRELREETGFRAGETTFLQRYPVATGVLRHRRGIVVATDLEAGEPELDENEFLSVERVPRTEALERARAPPTNDATLEGLLLAAEDGHL